MKAVQLCVALCLAALPTWADDLRTAVAQAREHLQSERYDDAIRILQNAVPDAVQIADQTERSQALAAIHFYSALAFHELGNEPKVREELEEFFRFSNLNRIDSSKYDAPFVQLFNEMSRSRREDDGTVFDAAYPGFRSYTTERPKQLPLERWSATPDFVILATAEEKDNWKRLRDDDGRSRFVREFWSRRDPNRETEVNEFQQAFEARVVFADYTFGTEELRGSLSDRGKVFVLLGKPRILRIKPLTRAEGATIPRSSPILISGTVERWIYSGDQLRGVPKSYVEFKFITQDGYGRNVLQREFFPMKALAEAAKFPARIN